MLKYVLQAGFIRRPLEVNYRTTTDGEVKYFEMEEFAGGFLSKRKELPGGASSQGPPVTKKRKLQQKPKNRRWIKTKEPPRKWTPEEDKLLGDAVKVHGAKNWKAISELVPGRNHTQCLQRWGKVLAPGLKKGHWRKEEDAMLSQVVQELDVGSEANNWAVVAKRVQGRTAKQCRERWFNHLDPTIKRGAFTAHEDELVTYQQGKIGNRWSLISAMLPGRTEDAVKSRWKTLQRNGAKRLAKSLGSGSRSGSVSGSLASDSSGVGMASGASGVGGGSAAGSAGIGMEEFLGGGSNRLGGGGAAMGSSSASSSSSPSFSEAMASNEPQTLQIPVIPYHEHDDDSKPFFVKRVESRFRKVLVRQWPSFVRRVQNRFRKSLTRSWDCAQTAAGMEVPRDDAKMHNFKLFY
jgi:myb proto-oncogene protein